jgi:VWFA-related protein
VRDDGDPRTIVSLQYVDQTAGAAVAPEAAPPLYATNENVAAGRLVVFVIDEDNIRIGGGRAALRACERVVQGLTPADRLALYAIPGPGVRIPFTADFARVREAIARLTGRGAPIAAYRFNLSIAEAMRIADGDRLALQDAVARQCSGVPNCDEELGNEADLMAQDARDRALATVRAMRGVLADLATVEGPKTVVLVSEGFVTGRNLSDLSDLGAAAAAARVTLYSLRLGSDVFDISRAGPTSAGDSQVLAEGLETLTGLARGAVFTVTGSGAGVFERLARELSGYYLLAFEPAQADRDGKPHQIRIDVRRPGVTARFRREFSASADAAPAPSIEESVARAIRAPLVLTDLPLRVSTYTLADPSSQKARIAIAADIGRDHTAAAEIGVGYVLFDAAGRPVDMGVQRSTLMPARAGQPGPLHYTGAIVAAPGDYVLRFAAADADGRTGSIERPLHVQLATAGDLRLGDLVITERGSGSAAFTLPVVPSIGRGELVSYLEIYGGPGTRFDEAAVAIEVAESEDGPSLLQGQATLTDQGAPWTRSAVATMNVGLLPPGRYVARARVTLEGRPASVVSRTIDIGSPRAAAAVAAPATPAVGPASPPAGASAAPAIDVSLLVEPFKREVLLGADVLRPFVDELVANLDAPLPARLEPALEDARAGRLAAAGSKAKEPRLHPVATFLQGLAELERGELDHAANLFRSTLHAAPGSYAAMVYLGACYATGGRDDEAVGAWQTALTNFEDQPLVFILLIDAALRLGDAATALQTVKEAGAHWPEDDRLLRRVALVLLAARRPAEALTAFDRYLALHPEDAAVLLQALRAVYEVAAAGGAIESPDQDLVRAKRYAAEYERVKGPQLALVRTWIGYLEKRTRN